MFQQTWEALKHALANPTDTDAWNEFFLPILFNPINLLFSPDPRYILSFVFIGFVVMCVGMKHFTNPVLVGIPAAIAAAIFLIGLVNPDFQSIMFKGDNVPIVILLVVVPFFTWWGLRQAVLNDEYKAKAGKDLLKVSNTVANDPEDKVHTFPFLVHPEFIATIVCAVVLTVWSIVIMAPLEQPSEAARTPNPSKAPWYFLGLQEMLVYFDPWMAGVVMPSYIVLALMAIPYFDANKKGNGYYTWEERKWAISLFLFGFVILWVVLIINGTLLRGPGWNFFGPFQYWDHNKVEVLTNVNLSEYAAMLPLLDWINPTTLWPIREGAGFTFLGLYFVGLPLLGWVGCPTGGVFGLPVIRWFTGFLAGVKKMSRDYGALRYLVATHMVLMMMILPLKMYARWLFNLKYVIWIPELGINF